MFTLMACSACPPQWPKTGELTGFPQLVIPSEVACQAVALCEGLEEFLIRNMTQLSPTTVKDASQSTVPIDAIHVQGWVRTRRDSKDFAFIELNDGSCLHNLQIIAKNTLPNYAAVQRLSTGASISARGALIASQGKGQKWELVADKIDIVGTADDSYPLQKKGHTPEFLREIAHLRPRSNLFGCVFRVRSRLAFAIHKFFQERGFVYIHTPIITGSDCEGAGELFRVTTIDCKNPPPHAGRRDRFRQGFLCAADLSHGKRATRGGSVRPSSI